MGLFGTRVLAGYFLLLLTPLFAYLKLKFPEGGDTIDALQAAVKEYLTTGNIAVVLLTLAMGVKLHLTPERQRTLWGYLLLLLAPLFAYIKAKHPEWIGVIQSLEEALKEYPSLGTVATLATAGVGGLLLHSAPPPNQSA